MKKNQGAAGRILRGGELPAELAKALSAAGIDLQEVLAALPADMAPDGHFEKHWLVLCPDRLAVAHNSLPGGAYRVSSEESFEGMKALEYRAGVGGGQVIVRRRSAGDIDSAKGDEQHVLLRCSPSTARGVRAALGKLREHLWKKGDSADSKKPGGDEGDEKNEEKRIEPEAVARLSAEEASRLRGQIDEIDEQRYCARCGLPLKSTSAVCPACVNCGRTLLRVLGLARAYRGRLALMGLLMTGGTLIALAPPFIYGRIFDLSLLPTAPTSPAARLSWLLLLVGAVALAQVASMVLRIFQGRTSVKVGAAVSRDLRGKVFRHLQLLSMGYFDKHKTGALMSRVNGDTRQLEGFLVDGVQWTAVSLIQGVLIATILFCMNWQLALLVLLPAPIVVIFTRNVMKKVIGRFRRLWEAMSRLSAVLNDSLRGIRVVKVFGRESQEVKRFGQRSSACHDAMVGAVGTWATLSPLLQLIMGAGAYLVWICAGSAIIGGNMSAGTLVTFIQYLPMLYGPLQLLTRMNQWITRSMTAGERIFEILDTEPEVAEAPGAVAMPEMRGQIELRDVTFGYDKHSPALKNVNLTIASGEMVGLVGPSGAGKSTTINLISRLYDADAGTVLIDGVDIRNIRLDDVRRQIGVVLQETYLFAGTIAENIAYARPDADRAAIMNAARGANAHKFIMARPDGYDAPVEEGGGNLSGGEKQRLAIARAILHDPRILILDEATSSVDAKTEKAIQEALGRLARGRTTIAIAHRLSTLRDANRLAVMEKGEITDVGSHQELTSREGTYKELVEAQTEMTSLIAVGG
jgi:ATP-binding cassette, subfamily B, bacterial